MTYVKINTRNYVCTLLTVIAVQCPKISDLH